MVVYIPVYHYIIKLEQINYEQINYYLEYIFILQQPCHNVGIVKKDYQGLDLMVVYSWNFAYVKKQPWRKIFFTKIFNFFSSCEVHIRCF